jgi:xanthine dehydrogenase iron-sulfur cluster and FAD-binding subunit A
MSEKHHVTATINGDVMEFLCEPRQSLLEVLRDVLFLTGTKEGCNDGNCGACNVTVDGVLVNACCVLGVEINGKAVATIEGMAQNGDLHPLQEAFLEARKQGCSAVSAHPDFSCRPGPCSRSIPRHRKPRSGTGWQVIFADVLVMIELSLLCKRQRG